MRITAIDQRKLDFEDGLSGIHLQNLKRIVILAGTNGSGKTRLLRRVEQINGHGLGEPDDRILQHHKIDGNGKFLSPNVQYNRMKRHAVGVSTEPPRLPKYENTASLIEIVPFVSRNLKLSDPNEMTQKVLLANAQEAEAPGVEHLAKACLAYIQRCQGRFWESSHPQSNLAKEEKDHLATQYSDLKELIQLVMQANLDRNTDGVATLFGRPISQTGLSDGQRALLQWCVGLHAQQTKLHKVVLTMDEPENHLHPDALNGTVGRIIDANSAGQMWIGTHSVPLIAFLFYRYSDEISLYFMDHGVPHFSGRSPEKVLTSLMGGEGNIQALREFIDLPGVFATNRFAAECLLPPTIVSNERPDDPQALVTGAALFAHGGERTSVRLLDFGAGHGRLLECLHALHGERLSEILEYFAWDVASIPDERCVAAIRKVYGDEVERWFNQLNELAAKCQAASFDVIVMCNVLHEVAPSEWTGLFGAANVIRSQLKADGKLLIVEDYLMPKGEYAHPYGFIVLDTLALQKLFGSTSGPNEITVINAEGERYKNRIKAHVIPPRLLENVNGDSIKRCLEFAIGNAEEHIRNSRGTSTVEFKSGQAHAFWVQQFANATLARKSFG